MNNIPGVACGLALLAVLTGGCGQEIVEEVAIRPVPAIKVGDLTALGGRQFPGRASAKREVDLSFQVSGPLVVLSVDVGSQVTEGDVIAAIDPKDFQAALDNARGNLSRSQANLVAMETGARPEEIEQLRAALTEAEALLRQAVSEFERNERLLPEGAVSQAEYDMSLARRDRNEAEVKQAQEELNIGLRGARAEDIAAKRAEIQALEAAVTNAQNQLDYATLRAPFSGTVAARYVDNFQTVQSQQPIVRLLDISKIEVTVQVPENVISLVPLVKQAVCRFDALADREFTGPITKIGSEASRTTRTYPVTVELDQPADVQILPGMAASVRGQPPEEAGLATPDLIVPPGAVFVAETGQQAHVWVAEESAGDLHYVTRREVTTGQLLPVGIAITTGLQVGEWVVTAGVNSLREKQPVRILQEGSH